MISSIRLSPQFILSLFMVFDDISRYVYHNTNYPYSVLFFLNKSDIIIKDKFDPWMIKLISFFN